MLYMGPADTLPYKDLFIHLRLREGHELDNQVTNRPIWTTNSIVDLTPTVRCQHTFFCFRFYVIIEFRC